MNLLEKIQYKLNYNFRRYVLRDPFLIAAPRWVTDKGDETLRLDYPLNQSSVVFDLGGYHGDFAAAIHEKFGSKIYIFEPVPQFHQMCVERFKGNDQIVCLNYGLSSHDGWLDISLADNASSFASPHAKGATLQVQIRSIVECIRELGVKKIDLMKINIEGGEFEVIPAMIESGEIARVRYLQVQFHNFVKKATKQRKAIRAQLAQTHTEMWNYEFVWESWMLKVEVQ